jgi:hypothetical protein
MSNQISVAKEVYRGIMTSVSIKVISRAKKTSLSEDAELFCPTCRIGEFGSYMPQKCVIAIRI